MKRWLIFAGVILFAILAGFPFYRELGRLKDIKRDKKQFQKIQISDSQTNQSLRKPDSFWKNRFSQNIRSRLSSLGFFPATVPAPDRFFDLTGITNNNYQLSTYSDNWVLLNFWTTWCAPCRMEMPSLQHLENKLNNEQFSVITINLMEDSDRVRRFKDNYSLKFPILLDRDGTVASTYGVTGVPESWLIDPSGQPVAKLIGPLEWDKPKIVTLFKQLTTS